MWCVRCERQSIELLPDEGVAGGAAAGTAGQGGSETAASGTSGTSGGKGGAGPLDGGWNGNCPPGEDCPDDPNFECPPNVDACQRCDEESDCDWPLHCSSVSGRCVECVFDYHCDDPEASRCHPLANRCVPRCDADYDACPPDLPICDDSTNTCGQCLEHSHCPSGVCILGECVECATNEHCPEDEPFCRNFSCRPSP